MYFYGHVVDLCIQSGTWMAAGEHAGADLSSNSICFLYFVSLTVPGAEVCIFGTIQLILLHQTYSIKCSYHPRAQERESNWTEWLVIHSTNFRHHEMLRKASQRLHHLLPPDTLNPLQFAYRPDRSMNKAITIALHTALIHLDKRNAYSMWGCCSLTTALSSIPYCHLNSSQSSRPWDWTPPYATGSWTSWWVAPRWHHYFRHNDPQHRGPRRVHPQSPSVFPVYPRLRGFTQFQLHHQVRWRHDSSRPDYQQRQDSLHGGGRHSDDVVPGKQPLLQHQQNKGADCGLQEEPGWARPHPHQRCPVETIKNAKFLGVHISNELKWSNHTDTVVKKARQQLFNLNNKHLPCLHSNGHLSLLHCKYVYIIRFYYCFIHFSFPPLLLPPSTDTYPAFTPPMDIYHCTVLLLLLLLSHSLLFWPALFELGALEF